MGEVISLSHAYTSVLEWDCWDGGLQEGSFMDMTEHDVAEGPPALLLVCQMEHDYDGIARVANSYGSAFHTVSWWITEPCVSSQGSEGEVTLPFWHMSKL